MYWGILFVQFHYYYPATKSVESKGQKSLYGRIYSSIQTFEEKSFKICIKILNLNNPLK